jgi:hypothetical protein
MRWRDQAVLRCRPPRGAECAPLRVSAWLLRRAVGAETRLSQVMDRLFRVPSGSLQRGLIPGGETYLDGTTNRGGIVVSPRTKHDAPWFWRDKGPNRPVDPEPSLVIVFGGALGWVDPRSRGTGKGVAIVTAREK